MGTGISCRPSSLCASLVSPFPLSLRYASQSVPAIGSARLSSTPRSSRIRWCSTAMMRERQSRRLSMTASLFLLSLLLIAVVAPTPAAATAKTTGTRLAAFGHGGSDHAKGIRGGTAVLAPRCDQEKLSSSSKSFILAPWGLLRLTCRSIFLYFFSHSSLSIFFLSKRSLCSSVWRVRHSHFIYFSHFSSLFPRF